MGSSEMPPLSPCGAGDGKESHRSLTELVAHVGVLALNPVAVR